MQIKANHLTYTYMKNTPFETNAIDKLDLMIPGEQFTSIIGHTGSGKSTLVQHFNGLLKPTDGSIKIGEWTVKSDTKQKLLYPLRRHVGMVFQFPEHQLFHETILADVAYGPMNFGFSKEEAEKVAKECLANVGIDDQLFDRSPFDVSGGQMRRVAIAGVLALDPELLILDEPTAGLDPEGQEMMMKLFHDWYEEREERSIILVTHQMEDAARYSDEVIVMDGGNVIDRGTPRQIFAKKAELEKIGLTVPESVQLLEALQAHSESELNTSAFTLEDTVESILSFLHKKGRD
ncbi:energy-coupling factor transporter ATPase [Salipaludibacillus daqingensis]|uniref:energy-coupling factor transporter ATPase n=1 Tax=Salipaludibacillus daqingensis TaxID=3041001 RepID=UPI0024744ED4|nr:energy-coupling factor transporter ATPase [Salipaludibacillus daqingensis]